MLLRRVEYALPTTVDEAVELLSSSENARALAGGQTLINVMKTRFASPDLLVDIRRIPGLDGIAARADGSVELGAMATYTTLARHSELADAWPIVGEVANVIADRQVQNRGTIGGNVCANDPTNHFPPLMVALGASMTIVGPQGERVVAAGDFFEGVYETAVRPGELLTKVALPAPGPGEGAGYASMTIGKEGTGIVNVAAALRCNGTVEEPRIAIGCVAATPVRGRRMETALEGKTPTESNVRLAAQGLGETIDPPSDVHASGDFRRHIAEVMAVRATLQAIGRGIR